MAEKRSGKSGGGLGIFLQATYGASVEDKEKPCEINRRG
jgi:hypothetical protein